jgi:hypothetical protein
MVPTRLNRGDLMYRFRTIAVAVVALALPALASASTLTLQAISRGSYNASGFFDTGGAGSATGNYVTGQLRPGLNAPYEDRSFFVFDLSSVTDTIVSASFQVSTVTYLGDASETVTLFDVSTSLSALTAGTGGLGAFTDLGAGTPYGSRAFTAADPLLTPVNFALDAAALAALNAASGSEFAFGGALTTISGTSTQVATAFLALLSSCSKHDRRRHPCRSRFRCCSSAADSSASRRGSATANSEADAYKAGS